MGGDPGSSPLARGLLYLKDMATLLSRIIPARAGFTLTRGESFASRWDHPRSRGVYGVASLGEEPGAGSSPLARGLPMVWDPCCEPAGIIPARAGFTVACDHGPEREPDHPRSRGVYALVCKPDEGVRGSSPLARGLRQGSGSSGTCRGIIPARAGFTPTASAVWGGFADHPRSRGVYDRSENRYRSVIGSSPLARGLPRRRPGGAIRSRIIPARAGFT